MPFTPFHMGPGIVIKALLQGSFSLMVFGWSQIIMDIQPLIVLLTGEGQLHGFSHTYIGATLLAVFAAVSGKYLSEIALSVLSLNKPWTLKISWWVAVVSAFVGTFSHIVLDSIMHSDMLPFYPFTDDNGLLGVLTVANLHKLCVYSALFGGLLYFIVYALRKRKEATT